MNDNTPYQRVDENRLLFVVEKATYLGNEGFYILVRWRPMHHFVRYTICHYHLIVGSKPARVLIVAQCLLRHQPVHMLQKLWGKRPVLALHNKLYGLIVVGNHLLRLVFGLSLLA